MLKSVEKEIENIAAADILSDNNGSSICHPREEGKCDILKGPQNGNSGRIFISHIRKDGVIGNRPESPERFVHHNGKRLAGKKPCK